MARILCPDFVPARDLLLTPSRSRLQNTAVFNFQSPKHGKLFPTGRTLLHFLGSRSDKVELTLRVTKAAKRDLGNHHSESDGYYKRRSTAIGLTGPVADGCQCGGFPMAGGTCRNLRRLPAGIWDVGWLCLGAVFSHTPISISHCSGCQSISCDADDRTKNVLQTRQ